MYTLARVCETVGATCASTAICFGMHAVGSAVIAAKPSEHQKRRFIDPIVAGRHLTTLALSEPGTGSHFWVPQTVCEPQGGMLSLTGSKSFVTNGGFADSYVMNVVADDTTLAGTFSLVMVPAGSPRLRWGPPWNGIGMRGNSSRNADLDGVTVPAANLLGEEGDQIWYVFSVVAPYFLTAMAGVYLGVAAAAFDEATDWIGKRTLNDSGRGVASFEVVQHHVGELWARLERTRSLLWSACERGDRGSSTSLPALCSAKAEVAECANSIVGDCMTLMGGAGYREASAMDRRLRDARASHVMSPTTDLLRLWTGRSILGQPLLT